MMETSAVAAAATTPKRKRRGGRNRGGAKKSGNLTDARLKIIANNRSKLKDAREKLTVKTKVTDARDKIKKNRNQQNDSPSVVAKKGRITITKTKTGKLSLTTAKLSTPKTDKTNQKNDEKKRTPRKTPGSQNRDKANSSNSRRRSTGQTSQRRSPNERSKNRRSSYEHGRADLSNRNLTFATRIDDSILNNRHPTSYPASSSREDPFQSRRSFENRHQQIDIINRPAEPIRDILIDPYDRSQLMDFNSRPAVRPQPQPHDFNLQRNDLDMYRRRPENDRQNDRQHDRQNDRQNDLFPPMRTMPAETGGIFASPLQGTKMIISNLQPTVSQEDIAELYGEIGAIKSVRLSADGVAEVIYVNRVDALKALDIYHNRQLDGRTMKCEIVENNHVQGYDLQRSGRDPPPDLASIHKALFNDRRSFQGQDRFRPQFSVTVPKTVRRSDYY